MNQRHFCKSLVLALPLLLAASLHAAGLTNLRCEYLKDPLGIDVAKPRLSWNIDGAPSEISNPKSPIPRGLKQTAYQVLVASTPELLIEDHGDFWDSGQVASDRSVAIPYGGPVLESGQTYHSARCAFGTARVRFPRGAIPRGGPWESSSPRTGRLAGSENRRNHPAPTLRTSLSSEPPTARSTAR